MSIVERRKNVIAWAEKKIAMSDRFRYGTDWVTSDLLDECRTDNGGVML
jgi:hypothetical protein